MDRDRFPGHQHPFGGKLDDGISILGHDRHRRPDSDRRRSDAALSSRRTPGAPPPDDGTDVRSVLLAIDGSRSSEAALMIAVELAQARTADLIIVHVAPLFDIEWDQDEEVVAVPHDLATWELDVLRGAAAYASGRAVSTSIALLRGSAVEEIVAYGESHAIDLIVVGSRGRRTAVAAILGSVSLGVLTKSARPVLIAHGTGSTPGRVARAPETSTASSRPGPRQPATRPSRTRPFDL